MTRRVGREVGFNPDAGHDSAMADDRYARLRGLMVREAVKRKREGLVKASGAPNCEAIAKRMGVKRPTVWRIMRGQPWERKDVKRPRARSTRPSGEVIDGLKRWLGFVNDQSVLDAIDAADEHPPFESLD